MYVWTISTGSDEKENSIGTGDQRGGGTATQMEDNDYHRSDEQVNICLDCDERQIKPLKRRYIR